MAALSAARAVRRLLFAIVALAGAQGALGPAAAQDLTNVAQGDLAGFPLDPTRATVRLTRIGTALTSAAAEVRPSLLLAGSIAQSMTCDLLPTSGPGDTGFRRVGIVLPPGFTNASVASVEVGGVGLAPASALPGAGEYGVTLAGDSVLVDLGSKVTTSGALVSIGLAVDVSPTGGTADFAAFVADGNLVSPALPGDADGIPGNADGLSVRIVESQGIVLALETVADRNEVVVGEVVTFTVAVRNRVTEDVESVRIESALPPNFAYVEGSARVDGVPVDAPGTRSLRFDLGTVPALVESGGTGSAGPGDPGYRSIVYQTVVGAGATPGAWSGSTIATDYCDVCLISNEAVAEVDVVLDPDFDLGTLVGKVFRDDDGDGIQDPGEHGWPDVRIVLDDGTIARTDEHGRYHIPAVEPGHRLLKLDRESVPAVVDPSGPEDVLVRVTPGLLAKASFGVPILEETVEIGREEVLGRAMIREVGDNSVAVIGNVSGPAVLVNGREVEIPTVSVRATQGGREGVIELREGAVLEPVRFRPTWQSSLDPAGWTLTLADTAGIALRTMAGTGPVPEEIVWDGAVDRGAQVRGPGLAAGERISYRLEVRFPDGSRAASPRRILGVRAVSPVSFRISGDSFESDEVELSAPARRALEDAARVIRRFPNETIVVEGHTDDLGALEHNLRLSQRRARAAVDYLTNELGLPSAQFVPRGLADSRPIGSNSTPEGRALNRRVEIRAELEEAVGREVVEAVRAETGVVIDGRPVEIDEFGRFTRRISDITRGELPIEVRDADGGFFETTIPLPVFELREPTGIRVVPAAGDGEEEGGSEFVTELAGRTDPANEVRVDDVELPLRPDGTIDREFRLDGELNTFRIFVRNPEGYTRVVNLSVDVSEHDGSGRRWIASERVPPLEVRLPPAGEPLPGRRVAVRGRTDPENAIVVNGRACDVDADGTFRATADLPPGEERIVVTVEDPGGRRGTIERDVAVADPGLFLLAFADGEFGRLRTSGNVTAAGEDDSRRWYAEGRLAYYLEGWIAGKYLVRSALDTGRQEMESLFDDLGPDESRRLARNLDPDKIYPVYGDGSSVEYAAESQGGFYLGIRSEELQVVLGSYPVDLDGPELATYRRTLSGGRVAYESLSRTRYGEPDTKVVVFGADVRLVNVRNELAATGGSLYYLSHGDVVEGSEQVTLEIRDRNTGLLLRREPQLRNVDYSVKYEEGRVFFHRPIRAFLPDEASIVDESPAAGHPVFVRIDFETRAGFLEETAAGARGRQQIGDHVAVGGTWVDDRQPGGTYELRGVDGEIRVGESRFTAEYAESEGRDARTLVSPDGGVTWGEEPGELTREGAAWKVATELEVGEWVGRPGRLRVGGWYQEQEPGFAAAGRRLDRGTTRHGGTMEIRPIESGRLSVRYHGEEVEARADPRDASRTSLLSAQWDQTRGDWGLSLEFQDRGREGGEVRSRGDARSAAARLTRRIHERGLARLEHQASFDGPANDQTTVGVELEVHRHLALDLEGMHGDRGDGAQAGAIVKWGGGRLYVRERVTDDPAGGRTSTVVGAESPLGPASRVYTEYQWDRGGPSDRTLSLLGVQRNWEASPGLSVVLGAEHADIEASSGASDRASVAGGVSWAPRDGLTTGSRNEVRRETGAADRLQWVTSNRIDLGVSPDFTLLGSFRFGRTEDRERGRLEARFHETSVGIAYRPVATDRYQGLARYTRLADLRPFADSAGGIAERLRNVISVEGTVDVTTRLQWYGKGAARISEDGVASLPSVTTHTWLGIQRLDWTLLEPIDLGIEYRILAQREADDHRAGWVTEVSRRFGEHLRLGVGYDFTDFSDDEFADDDYTVRGWYLRAHGRY